MEPPDRTTLPTDFVEFLERQAENLGARYGSKPVLPAGETPEELVRAAILLRELLDEFLATGSAIAQDFDNYLGEIIKKVLSKQITEPVDLRVPPDMKYEEDFAQRDDLRRAYIDFLQLVRGTDHSDPHSMSIVRRATVMQRKAKAAEIGLDLELTDDQWFAL